MTVRLATIAVLTAILILAGACAQAPQAAPPQPPAPPPTAVPPTAVPATETPLPTPVPATPVSVASEAHAALAAALEAFSQRDLDKALSYYADEGLSFLSGGQIIKDKAALRTSFEVGVGVGETDEVGECVPKGQGAACAVISRNAACNKAQCGLDAYRVTADVVVKDGRITSYYINASNSEDRKACNDNYLKFDKWARANQAAEFKAVTAAGADAPKGRAWGEAWTKLCQAYLDSLK